MRKKRVSVLQYIGLSEILLLVLSTFAIAFIVGETQIVDAQSPSFINTQPSTSSGLSVGSFGAKTPSPISLPSKTGPGLIATSSAPFVADPSLVGTTTPSVGTGTPAATSAGSGEILDFFGELFSGHGGLKTDPATGKVIEGQYNPGVFGAEFQGLNHLVSGLAYAAVAAGVTYMVASLLGASNEQAKAAALSVALGTGIARFGFLQATQQGAGNFAGNFFSQLGFGGAGGAFLWGVGIAAVAFVALYKKESKKVVELQCLPWEAPLGGSDCEKCNQDPLKPCSEYRCKSLGQACELVNPGTSEERCTWTSRNDVTSPTITPSQNDLSEGHVYTRHDTRPPSLGTKIVRQAGNGCIAPFTRLQFGIVLNEPGQCKIDYTRANGTEAFEEMSFFFGESSLYRYNHTQEMRLPSVTSVNELAESAGAPELMSDGTYNLYVRCRDANGNVNADDFVFNFCVDPSPDTTPPVIESTSIIDNSPVNFGAQNVSLSVYLNEPAECKWSVQDKNYDDMENSMSCSREIYEQNARQLYPCTGTLSGLKDRESNEFYFRCKDQPNKPDNERNINSQSYVLTIRGSQPLNIIKTSPSGTITGSTDSVKVDIEAETSNGADEGKSICYFSPIGLEGSYVQMFQTNSFEHKQTLTLAGGNYQYYLRCIDAGGNADNKNISFSVLTDRLAPRVTRAYKQQPDALKIVVNEEAECAYSLNSCNFNFEEGIEFIYNPISVKNTLYAKWEDSKTYYIKCRDAYNNQPAPEACSMIVSASKL